MPHDGHSVNETAPPDDPPATGGCVVPADEECPADPPLGVVARRLADLADDIAAGRADPDRLAEVARELQALADRVEWLEAEGPSRPG